MNKVKKIIILILFFFLSLLFFDRLFTYVIFEYNHHFFPSGDFEEELKEHLGKNNYNAIILGSSRTYEGIHPDLIRTRKLNPFKWSFAGFGPKYNYYFYQMFKKNEGIPEVIVFGIDYFIYNLFSSPEALAELNCSEDISPNIDYLDPEILLMKNKTKIDIIIKDILRTFTPSDNTLKRDINKIQSYTGTKKGELKNYKVHTVRTEKIKGSAFTKPPGSEGDYFLQLLEQLRDEKVNVVLVVIPEYIGTFRTNKFQTMFRIHLKNLKKKFKNITILNYNYIKKFNLGDDTLFLDGGYGYTNSHLSKKGAEIFNRLLRTNLERIGY